MIVETQSPSCELQDLVKEFYYIHIPLQNNRSKVPVIDDCCYDLVFYKEAKGVLYEGIFQIPHELHKNIFTIHDLHPPFKIQFNGPLSFFTIKLQPWVNALFFSYLTTPGVFELGHKHPQLNTLYHNIYSVPTLSEKKKLAESYLLNAQYQLTPSMLFAQKLCQFIYQKKGLLSVNELSDHFGKSRQYLNKVFQKEVMYSIKKFITTVRILDLIKLKKETPEMSLTHLCLEYEYFDQSHFIKDFKNVCGVTPKAFFNNLPDFLLRH